MKTVNIFDRKVSYFRSVKSTKPEGEVTFLSVLESAKHKNEIELYRKSKNKSIKESLPCYTVSGTFSARNEDSLIEHSGVVCIDIDRKDNTDVENFEEIKTLIQQIPYVAYCGRSCGGEGYFVLIPIENTDKHREHYNSLIEDFTRCDVQVDKSCRNLSRTRIISFDDDAYFNYKAVVYSRMKEEEELEQLEDGHKKIEKTHSKKQTLFRSDVLERIEYEDCKFDVELVIMLIERKEVDITADYNDWVKVGAALANQFGEEGRKYFHRVSCFYPEYKRYETDCKYKSCAKLDQITIGTFFHIAREHGCELW